MLETTHGSVTIAGILGMWGLCLMQMMWRGVAESISRAAGQERKIPLHAVLQLTQESAFGNGMLVDVEESVQRVSGRREWGCVNAAPAMCDCSHNMSTAFEHHVHVVAIATPRLPTFGGYVTGAR